MKRYLKPFAILVFATVFPIWVIEQIPWKHLPVHKMWLGISIHLVQTLISLAFFRIFVGKGVVRNPLSRGWRTWLAVLFVFGMVNWPAIVTVSTRAQSIVDVLLAFIFTMSIGLDEEMFSRKFAFNLFKPLGLPFAVAISSIHFGAMHYTKYLWGFQSLIETIGQMIIATAFEVLCCALYLVSGKLIFPIVMHALVDMPHQFSDSPTPDTSGTAQQVSFDWLGTFMYSFYYLLCAAILFFVYRVKTNKAYRDLYFVEEPVQTL